VGETSPVETQGPRLEMMRNLGGNQEGSSNPLCSEKLPLLTGPSGFSELEFSFHTSFFSDLVGAFIL
jgi:hypothetical protein